MINTTIGQKDYNSNLKEYKRHIITCTSCGKYLGVIVELDLPVVKMTSDVKHQCFCPCGHECFLVKTNRSTFILTEDKYTLLDMITIDKLNKIKIGKHNER